MGEKQDNEFDPGGHEQATLVEQGDELVERVERFVAAARMSIRSDRMYEIGGDRLNLSDIEALIRSLTETRRERDKWQSLADSFEQQLFAALLPTPPESERLNQGDV